MAHRSFVRLGVHRGNEQSVRDFVAFLPPFFAAFLPPCGRRCGAEDSSKERRLKKPKKRALVMCRRPSSDDRSFSLVFFFFLSVCVCVSV